MTSYEFLDRNSAVQSAEDCIWVSASGSERRLAEMPPMYRGNALRLLIRTYGIEILKSRTAQAIMELGYESPSNEDEDEDYES